jgi:hypothetical protein
MSDRVSLSDLESKLRQIGGSAQSAATEVAAPALGGAVAAAVALVAAVYLLGRRRGRKEAPVLEIRRV